MLQIDDEQNILLCPPRYFWDTWSTRIIVVLFQGFEDSFDQFVRNQFSFTPESENIVQR